MTEQDHKAIALARLVDATVLVDQALDWSGKNGMHAAAQTEALIAQTHAILYLAEQLRVASDSVATQIKKGAAA